MNKKQNIAIIKLVNEWKKDEPNICKDYDGDVFVGLFDWLLTSNRIKGVKV
jgi:hypothetical protein